MDERFKGLPGIVEAGLSAASWKGRALSLAAAAAAIRQGAAYRSRSAVSPAEALPGRPEAERLQAEADAVFQRAFLQPGTGDFGRIAALLRLGAMATREDSDRHEAHPPSGAAEDGDQC